MKMFKYLLLFVVLFFAITVFAHNGIDHSKGENHESSSHESSSHTHHDDPLFNTVSGVLYASGFVLSGGIIARDMRKNKIS